MKKKPNLKSSIKTWVTTGEKPLKEKQKLCHLPSVMNTMLQRSDKEVFCKKDVFL